MRVCVLVYLHTHTHMACMAYVNGVASLAYYEPGGIFANPNSSTRRARVCRAVVAFIRVCVCVCLVECVCVCSCTYTISMNGTLITERRCAVYGLVCVFVISLSLCLGIVESLLSPSRSPTASSSASSARCAGADDCGVENEITLYAIYKSVLVCVRYIVLSVHFPATH